MELFLDALLDALIDGVKMLPFLYLAYLLIEWLERHHGESIEGASQAAGAGGSSPVHCWAVCRSAASVRWPPTCTQAGSSRPVRCWRCSSRPATRPSRCWRRSVPVDHACAAAGLQGGVCHRGRLAAGHPAAPRSAALPLRRLRGHADDVDCHEEHEESSSIFMAALRHTLEIFVFILLFSFIISLLFEGFGEEPITAALSGMGIFQPMLTALVGLVPTARSACCWPSSTCREPSASAACSPA